jgi:DNA (cytosine-5)-methyltransferase 1
MKYLSTFSGIGGFELGIQLAYESNNEHAHISEESEQKERPQRGVGTTNLNKIQLHAGDRSAPLCVGYSEIDKYASSIYQKHFPYEQCEKCRSKNEESGVQGVGNAERFNSERNNISTIGLACSCKHKPYGDITKIVAEDLPDFDLLVGGFPCQAFSIAGKRGGFEDTRGTMFFELARILRAKQPRLCVFENVKGLLSHDGGKSFATIIQTLDELGYDCEWQVLNSKNHGVPQNRERVFIIGHLRGTPRPKVFPFGSSTETTLGDCEISNTSKREFGFRKVSPTLLSRDYKDPKLVQINQPKHSNDRVYGTDGISPTLNTMQGGNRQPFIAAERGRYNKDGSTSQKLEHRKDNVSNTLTSVEKDNRLIEGIKIRRLTPTECERLQGFPDGWTEGVSDTQRYKTLGNAVTVNVTAFPNVL